jgi:hypothetical protein
MVVSLLRIAIVHWCKYNENISVNGASTIKLNSATKCITYGEVTTDTIARCKDSEAQSTSTDVNHERR